MVLRLVMDALWSPAGAAFAKRMRGKNEDGRNALPFGSMDLSVPMISLISGRVPLGEGGARGPLDRY